MKHQYELHTLKTIDLSQAADSNQRAINTLIENVAPHLFALQQHTHAPEVSKLVNSLANGVLHALYQVNTTARSFSGVIDDYAPILADCRPTITALIDAVAENKLLAKANQRGTQPKP